MKESTWEGAGDAAHSEGSGWKGQGRDGTVLIQKGLLLLLLLLLLTLLLLYCSIIELFLINGMEAVWWLPPRFLVHIRASPVIGQRQPAEAVGDVVHSKGVVG